MTIRFLGHAGFFVEAGDDRILADPWLHPAGAYAASWFPFPSNSHIDPASLESATILYISHWHLDHLDEWFLTNRSENFKKRCQIVIPKFKYKKLFETLTNCGYLNIRELASFEVFETVSGTRLEIIFDSNPLFVDSALLIRSGNFSFLDANDCKLPIADEERIVSECGNIDVYSAQFSGATFHPTCYQYDEKKKREISEMRRAAKFDRIISSIGRLQTAYYIPSAGPACFLSDDLIHLNLNPATVFSTATDFRNYVSSKDISLLPKIVDLAPDESISLPLAVEIRKSASAVDTKEYLANYAESKKNVILQELEKYRVPGGDILSDAKDHFRSLYNLSPGLGKLAATNLYVKITGDNGGAFYFNTSNGIISSNRFENDQQNYTLTLTSFWMKAIVHELINWEDFILSFRFLLDRDPDIYNEAIIAFLHLESAEERNDYLRYHEYLSEGKRERIIRPYNGVLFEHDRFCPHNGEDLSCAEIKDGILTCPRHFWQFLIEDGCGINNSASINSKRIEY